MPSLFRQNVLKIGASAIFLWVCYSGSWACSPRPEWDPSVQSRLKAAAYVVHARVLSVEVPHETGTITAQIQVLRLFKGSNPPTTIRSRDNSCGISFAKGEENVFFIHSSGYVNLLTQPISTPVPEVVRQLKVLTQ